MKEFMSGINSRLSQKEKYFLFGYVLVGLVTIVTFSNIFSSADIKSNESIYSKTKLAVDTAHLNDSALVYETVAIHNAVFPDFEKISKLRGALAVSLTDINDINSRLPNKAKELHGSVVVYSTDLQLRLDKLDGYLADFKSLVASEKYLPVAKQELLSEMRAAKIIDFDIYKSLVNQIYFDVQQFLQIPEQEQKPILFSNLERYEEKLDRIAEPVMGLKGFISQSRVLVEAKLSSNAKLQEFFELDSLSSYNNILAGIDGFLQAQWLLDRKASVSVMSALVLGFFLLSLIFVVWVLLFSRTSSVTAVIASNDQPFGELDDSARHGTTNDSAGRLYNGQEGLGELATILTHQLKTPVNHINKNINNLKPILEDAHHALNALDNETQLSSLPKSVVSLVKSKSISEFPFIIDEINEGVSTVNDLLDSVKILSSNKRQDKISLDANVLVQKAIRMKRDELLQSCSNFKVSLDDTTGIFRAVSIDIINAISYVIDNAIDAVKVNSNTLGLVEISTSIQEKTVKIMIQDNGIGISKVDIKRIYEPFFGTKDSIENLGMGLTYAKQCVERNGGKITIVPGIDSGTLVRISFPLLECSDFRKYIVDDPSSDVRGDSTLKITESVSSGSINDPSVSDMNLTEVSSKKTNKKRKRSQNKLVIKQAKSGNISLFSESDAKLKVAENG